MSRARARELSIQLAYAALHIFGAALSIAAVAHHTRRAWLVVTDRPLPPGKLAALPEE